jgi:NAD(P)-dependent dehydrogenase (short-subunit alcohol dehydrogenase family)
MQEFDGKVAFVTGAASGIGLGISRALAGAGMKVMLADIEKPALDAAAKSLRAGGAAIETIVCDVSDARSMRAAADATIAAFGKVHVLCNNAGVSTGGLVEELDDGDWDWVVGVNYLGVLNGCRAFLPHIKRHREGGHIVNTSSMAGLLGGQAGWGPYNSTKFAVVGLTEVLRQEGREGGFGASVLCPGGVNTNIYESPRNRPGRFGPQVSKPAVEDIREALKSGLDPTVVGKLVLEAIRDNRLYIFTDPRFRKMVETRYQRILEDFDWAADSQALNDAHAPGSKTTR